jgi:hypothetical protein
MTDTPQRSPRPLTPAEHALLLALLSQDFAQADALRAQLTKLMVTTETDGCSITLQFFVDDTVTTRYRGDWSIPVWATGRDAAGQPVDLALEVLDGKLANLEIVGFRSQPIAGIPEPSALRYSLTENMEAFGGRPRNLREQQS